MMIRACSLALPLLFLIATETLDFAEAQARLPSLKEVNLLAPDQGGQALVVPDDGWFKPISGDEKQFASVAAGQEAVYAFKDEKPAIFSKFSVLFLNSLTITQSKSSFWWRMIRRRARSARSAHSIS